MSRKAQVRVSVPHRPQFRLSSAPGAQVGATGFVADGFFDTSGPPATDISTYSDETLVAWIQEREAAP